jgi:hypothetical protein
MNEAQMLSILDNQTQDERYSYRTANQAKGSSKSIMKLYICLAAILVSLVVSFSTASASVHGKQLVQPLSSRKPTPAPEWTALEKAVWFALAEDSIADLNYISPEVADDSTDNLVIKASFLRQMLLVPPWRQFLSGRPVHIRNALIQGSLTLSRSRIVSALVLEKCRFVGNVDLSYAQFESSICLDGSFIIGDLCIRSAVVQGGVSMEGVKIEGSTDLSSLYTSGDVSFSSSSKIGRASEFKGVNLSNAHVGGSISMLGVEKDRMVYDFPPLFNGPVLLSFAKVMGNVRVKGAHFKDSFHLSATTVDGQLVIVASEFWGPVNLTKIKVTQTVYLSRSTFHEKLLLSKADVFSVILNGTHLRYIDLGNTVVKNSLVMGTSRPPGLAEARHTRWDEDGFINLGHAKIGVIDAPIKFWPNKANFTGLQYDYLGHCINRERDSLLELYSDELVPWLEKQKTFSPQLYYQLASCLQSNGYIAKANEVFYAGKKHEHSQAIGSTWFGMFLQWLFVGYGYRPWYAAIWIVFFLGVGTTIFKMSKRGEQHTVLDSLAFSIDLLLPVVRLREIHYDLDLPGSERYYFYFHQLVGYLLAVYLVASFSGLFKG